MTTKTNHAVLETAVVFADDLAHVMPADESEQGTIGKANWIIRLAEQFEKDHERLAKEKGLAYGCDYWSVQDFTATSENFTSGIAESDQVVKNLPVHGVLDLSIEGLRHLKGRLTFFDFAVEIYGEVPVEAGFQKDGHRLDLNVSRELYLRGKYKRFDEQGVLALWEDLDTGNRRRFLRALQN